LSISLLLEMAASAFSDREAVVDGETRLSAGRLNELADKAAAVVTMSGARHVAYVGTGGMMLPLLVFSCARAAVPLAPLNYRLSAEALKRLISRLPETLVVADAEYRDAVARAGAQFMASDDFLTAAQAAEPDPKFADPDEVAVLLFTSGTTSEPKAVELSHNNLTSYITGTVDFGSAEAHDTALIAVPPYHIAGVSAALSNLYAGRRMVYLRNFEPHQWIRLVKEEAVTGATVVPTMLDRIISALRQEPTELPSLRHLAYGGAKTPLPLVRAALELMPTVGFANAYGLTETSSTIAVLTPEDHREALASSDEAVRQRLTSVGRPVPGIEVQVRASDGTVVAPGQKGELFVRGPQVSGTYAEIGSVLDDDGWFPTKDVAAVDEAGYVYIGGRSDDTIIRGGENIAPAEIEDVLVEHPGVREVAVVGVENAEWGQLIVAVVVPSEAGTPDPEELRAFVRSSLRGSRTPDRIVFSEGLPTNAKGKVVRREIVDQLLAGQT
jgi:acyl-CoA synthetase (AMP-forming)/AMP-acid ligase II